MAKSDTQFKPGKTGNPNGRPKISKETRAMKKLNAENFEKAVAKLTSMSTDQLKKYIGLTIPKTPSKATALEMMVAGQIIAAWKGKTTPFSFLMDRTPGIGPVQQSLKIVGSPFDSLKNMSPEEEAEIRERIRRRREAKK